jgi:hypothetical protein
MRRLALLTSLFALALAPTAGAQDAVARALQDGGERVALENGRGIAAFNSRDGALLGSIRRGRVVITDVRRDSEVSVTGCERTKRVRRTIVCIGRELTFSIEMGAWRAVLRGVGINASAVLHGTLTLSGTAGRVSIDDGPSRRWPKQPRTYRLG